MIPHQHGCPCCHASPWCELACAIEPDLSSGNEPPRGAYHPCDACLDDAAVALARVQNRSEWLELLSSRLDAALDHLEAVYGSVTHTESRLAERDAAYQDSWEPTCMHLLSEAVSADLDREVLGP